MIFNKKNEKILVRGVPEFLGKVLDGNGRELSQFRGLPSNEFEAILTEVHQRSFLSGFLGSACSWERDRSSKGRNTEISGKADKKAVVLDGANIDNEVLGNIVCFKSKSKVKEIETHYVDVNKVVIVDGNKTMVPSREAKEVEVKKTAATAKVLFNFNYKDYVMEVKVLEVSAQDPATAPRYRRELERALKAAGDEMECFSNMNRFLKSFFDTLHVHKMAHINGNEAVLMRRIFRNAKVAFPLFAELDHSKQVDILDKGYARSRSVASGSRDIHAFAKGTFEAMCQEVGLIDKVYKHDFVTNQYMTYTKIAEHRRDRVNPDNHRQIWEKNCLIFVDYLYGKTNIRTSLLAFDLWDLLARGVRNSDRAVEEAIW